MPSRWIQEKAMTITKQKGLSVPLARLFLNQSCKFPFKNPVPLIISKNPPAALLSPAVLADGIMGGKFRLNLIKKSEWSSLTRQRCDRSRIARRQEAGYQKGISD